MERLLVTVPNVLQRANQFITIEMIVLSNHEMCKRKEKGFLKDSQWMKTSMKKWNKSKYYCIYCDYGHDGEKIESPP
ncbi:hypothetical protein C4D60_Mb07t08230 [Musa balbisiana]|uniref:Uncharacterized protein n=1 Tax=Musa balbisiana TaxID=52838 RepID=A0A4S8JDZ8_MUSBA|nr:hypothetical protein C4D60_Mb07t08230 [Musa balbisiana]